MGSRSKFHKSNVAATPGRALLHGPRPKRPTVMTFEGAFWEVVREQRALAAAGGYVRKFEPSKPVAHGASGKGPRDTRRAAVRALARSFTRSANASVPRAERRRAALAQATAAVLS